MRLVILFLVFFNMALFAWFSFKEKSAPVGHQVAFIVNFPAAKKLTLKSEIPQSQLAKMKAPKPQPKKDMALEIQQLAGKSYDENAEMCVLLGPYDEVVTARSHLLQLADRHIVADLREGTLLLPALYWVYVGPFESEEEALSVLQFLQESQIDSYLVAEGEYTNAVSLGVFRVKESAEKIKSDIARLGFTAKIELRKKEKKAIWLSFGQDGRSDFEQSLLESFKSENIFLKIQEKPCKAVALLKVIH